MGKIMRVCVLSNTKEPLMPCQPARARALLRAGKAKVFRARPFTIILTQRRTGDMQPIGFKVDPGSKTTGIALVATYQRGLQAIFAMHLHHRGQQIRNNLLSRRACRRGRRFRNTRYREARFDNRRRSPGWLPPSLRSRVDNVLSWGHKMQRMVPLTSIAVETVRFDMQTLVNPEISGVDYQRGELFGYEVREYLLEKWQRKCAYCSATNIPLEVEHIVPKSRGGSNRVSNLTLACRPCNQRKGNRRIEDFVHDTARLAQIKARSRAPLRDAAAVNATRYATGEALRKLGLPIAFWTGGRTKYNRTKRGYPKAHWIDAACVGKEGEHVLLSPHAQPLEVQAHGRGSRQMCRMDRFGFPRTRPKSQKRVQGFQTGDFVRAVVLAGKKSGTYVGRVAVRSTGNFNIRTATKTVQGIQSKYTRLLQRVDGYSYAA